MSASAVGPSRKAITATTHPVVSQSTDCDLKQFASKPKDTSSKDQTPQQVNLTQKISSPATYNDPFKNLYHADWAGPTLLNRGLPYFEANSAPESDPAISGTGPREVRDPASTKTEDEEVTYINGKFQNLTLQRVLALRKVQNAIRYAPNPSAVGADATTFSEDDLAALTMEELQALQRRKRDMGKEIQPLSVVKVSIQAERSKKRLEPRDYQLELYERARRENTIAVLGTGTGKTLIACLLIKDILVQERLHRVAEKKVQIDDCKC